MMQSTNVGVALVALALAGALFGCTGLRYEFLGPEAAYADDVRAATEAGAPILIYEAWPTRPDYASGVGVVLGVINTSPGSTIKYVSVMLRGYNKVGDPAPCRVSGSSLAHIKLTGPIRPGKSDSGTWRALWYNATIDRLIIDSVRVDYMDGTSVTVEGADVARLIRR